ncbi:lactose ABC transporter permease [Spirochaetia bacterium]|nr:lactose ABC transporter permease [Spirochaetia bacterium]
MKKISPAKVFVYIILSVVGVISAFPFYFMATAATNISVDVVRGRLFFGTYIINNLQNLIKTIPIGMGFINSLRNALVGTLASLFICSMAGYGFQIYRSKAKDRVMSVLLLSMMIPFAAVMVPLFRLTASLKLLNTTAGIIMPGLATAFLIFFFRQCSQSFPMEIVQAARVDGVSEFGIFLRVYIPVMSPTFAAAGIVSFMGGWNNYLWPLIILQKETSKTLPILISQLSSGYVTDYGMQLLAITISTIPTLVIFITQQRRFVEGILGSVK